MLTDLLAVDAVELLYGDAHGETHLDTAARVVVARLRTPADAVVAVAERADLLTAVTLTQVVEPTKQVVQQHHQVLGRLVGTHLGEAHDVREQDAYVVHLHTCTVLYYVLFPVILAVYSNYIKCFIAICIAIMFGMYAQ